jgi:hypothetical protein
LFATSRAVLFPTTVQPIWAPHATQLPALTHATLAKEALAGATAFGLLTTCQVDAARAGAGVANTTRRRWS